MFIIQEIDDVIVCFDRLILAKRIDNFHVPTNEQPQELDLSDIGTVGGAARVHNTAWHWTDEVLREKLAARM